MSHQRLRGSLLKHGNSPLSRFESQEIEKQKKRKMITNMVKRKEVKND